MHQVEPLRSRHTNKWITGLVLGSVFVTITLLMVFPSYELLVKPRGQSFDYYVIWVGGQTVLAGQNPYGPEPTRLIQLGVYKRVLPPSVYQHHFSLPAYTAFVLLPVIVIPFFWSVLLWLSLQIPLLLLVLLIGLNVLNWQIPPSWLFLLSIMAVIGFRYPVIAYVVGQMTIFVLFCLMLSAWLFQNGHIRWAAVVLAGATIRPDLAFMPLLATLVLLKSSPHRKQFITTLLGVELLLIILPVIWTGDLWPVTWLKTIHSYGSGNPFALWPPDLLGSPWLIVLLVTGLTLWLGHHIYTAWSRPTGSNQSLMASAMVLFGLVILPQTGAYTLTMALIPGVILVRYARSALMRAVVLGSMLTPWLYFMFNINQLAFLLIPFQFILFQEIISRSNPHRMEYT